MEDQKLKKCIIYYESWQMQCCGTPFSVGDKVKWTCSKPSDPNNVSKNGSTIDFYEDHHSPCATHSIFGTVKRIIAEYSEYPATLKEISYDTTKVVQEEVQYADGWNFEETRKGSMGTTFWGYIVELENATVKVVRHN